MEHILSYPLSYSLDSEIVKNWKIAKTVNFDTQYVKWLKNEKR